MKKQTIKETAAGGSTGAGSIGVFANRMGGTQRRSLKDFLVSFHSRVKNKMVMVPVAMQMGGTINEYYDLSDVVSRLKGIEGLDQKQDNTVSYGVEDDNGNIMKVTVKKDQAKDFEYRLSRDMADAKDNKLSGSKSNTSLAELLYDLKDEFNIVDVEFPTIPKDVIYNADKVTYGPDTSEVEETDDVNSDDADMDSDLSGDIDTDDMEGNGDFGDSEDLNVDGGEEVSDEDMDIEGENGDELDLDDESVEDFSDEEAPTSPESLLQSVMDMLKADAEAKTAQANATAEEARAKQAEYAYKSSQATVAHEEEFAKMEMDADAQKQKQKEAKRLADVAKYRVQKTSGMVAEGSILGRLIREFDDFDSVQSINRQKILIRTKYRPAPGDDAETLRYKQVALTNSLRELEARLKGVKARDAYANERAREATNGSQGNNQVPPNGQQQAPAGAVRSTGSIAPR